MHAETLPRETPDQRKDRQLANLQELNAIAITLARAEATNALEQSKQPGHPRKPDHHLAFGRHASTIRQCIALEIRLTAEPAARRQPRTPPPEPIDDPRQELLRTALHDHTSRAADRTRLRRALDQAVDQALRDDPDQNNPVLEILEVIAKRFRIAIQSSQLTDEILRYRTPRQRAEIDDGPPG